MASKSSTFYRLEKEIGDGWKSVVEFHTVVNGNMYTAEHEERPGGALGWNGKPKNTTKESGNKYYCKLKSNGYKFAGIWEMDILGVKTLISSEIKK